MRRLRLLAVLLAVAAAAGCGGSAPQRSDPAGAPQGSDPAATAPAQPGRGAAASGASHVVVLVMENQERDAVLDRSDAPFLAGLADRYAQAKASYGIRHPSLPNYLALISGSTHGIASNCTDCHVAAPNLADQLERAQRSWKGYMEGLPAPCSRVAVAARYAKKHNPFLYYDGVASSTARCRRVVGFRALADDLRRGTLPDFAFITPDLCHDTHDCPVTTGDRFLAGLVPRIERALGPHGFLVITWDEGETSAGCCGEARGGHIATVVVGPDVRRGAASVRPVDHYGVLRTIEDAFGLPRLGGAARAANGSLDDLFRRPPRLR